MKRLALLGMVLVLGSQAAAVDLVSCDERLKNGFLEPLIEDAVNPKAIRRFLSDLDKRGEKDRGPILRSLEELVLTGRSRYAYRTKHSHEVFELAPKGTPVRVLFAFEDGAVRLILGDVNLKAGSDKGGSRQRAVFENAVRLWESRN